MKRFTFPLLIIAIFLTTPLIAQNIAGSQDHPLIKRYTGSKIISYGTINFASYAIFLDPYVNKDPQKAEGEYFSINYEAPKGRAPLEVHLNYEQALVKAGFKEVYQCRNCDTYRYLDYTLKGQLPAEHYRGTVGMSGDGFYTAYVKGNTYVALFSATYYGEATHTVVDIVVGEEMETGMVEVNADLIKEELEKNGKLALYGITFDVGSATIKPSSDKELSEIAKFLKANPTVNLYIVGHTDDTGGMDLNLSLSEKRAKAVVANLSSKYGIAATRLTGKGVGPFAPVASNDTDKGKAKNRRVELVKRLK